MSAFCCAGSTGQNEMNAFRVHLVGMEDCSLWRAFDGNSGQILINDEAFR